MRRQKFFPIRSADQVRWLQHYAGRITAHLTAADMAGEAPGTVADALWLVYCRGNWLEAVRTFSTAGTEAVRRAERGRTDPGLATVPVFTPPAVPPGVVPVKPGALRRILRLVARLKASEAYQKAMGEDLGVIGPEDAAEHAAPPFSLELYQGPDRQGVAIRFTKYAHMGVLIECRRGDGGWEFVAVSTSKPFRDERPLLDPAVPEVREYRLRFWDKGHANGPWSDFARITVAP